MKLNGSMAALVAMLFAGSFATSALAQPQQQNFRGGQGQQVDPAQIGQQIRQTMNDRIREALGASDPEWAVLQPKIQKVQDAQNATGGGLAGAAGLQRMMRPAGAGGGQQININAMLGIKDSAMQQRMQELQKALDDPNATEAQIKLRLDSVREAKARAMEVLAQARRELIDVLTQRQEAVLFQYGILE